MTTFTLISKSILSVFLLSSISFAAGVESTTGVSTHSGAMLDSGTTTGAVKQTGPADGAITTPGNDAATGMTDKMQQPGITKKTGRARAKTVCATGDTACKTDPNPSK